MAGGSTRSWSLKGLSQPVLLAAGLAVAIYLLWRLASVVLLLFAAIIVGTGLSAFARMLQKYARLPRRLALIVAAAAILLLVGGFILLMGAEIRSQLGQLAVQLPPTLRALGHELGIAELDVRISDLVTGFMQNDTTLGSIANSTGDVLAILTTSLLVLIAGTYLAADPELYRRGLLALVPRPLRADLSRTLDEVGFALRHWLQGQLLTAFYIAVVTGTVLWLLGVPAALTLGLIAGLMEFVPYVGALAAALPAVVLAFSTGNPYLPVWVGGAYLLIQQFEGNILSPVVFQWAVRLPPVVGLFALIAFGVLFGPLGVLLATPLAVTILVLVQRLHIRDGALDLAKATAAKV